MADLTAANLARLNKILDKKYWFDGKLSSFRKQIECNYFVKSESVEVPSVKYNRNKYNRMNHSEQREYELKMEKKKTEHRLITADDCFHVVPKMVFEYFNRA